jgi:hypothetical protein
MLSVRDDPVRHCERNEVKRGNPESHHFAESLLPYSHSWVAASRVALLAMTDAALTLTPFVVSLSNHELALGKEI